jgi:hypothetical protein
MPDEKDNAGIENNQIINYNVTDAKLAELGAKYALAPTIEGTEGYKLVVAGLAETRTLRVGVEKKRKELKADALEWGRKVDGEAKRITERLEAIEEPLKAAKEKADAEKEKIRAEKEEKARLEILAEQKRVDGVLALIETTFGAAAQLVLHSYTADQLEANLADTSFEPGEEFGEFVALATARRDAFLDSARAILDAKRNAEAQAEAQRIEADRLAEERLQFEKLQEETRERDRLQQAERDCIETERVEKLKAEQDERDRIEKDRQEKIRLEQEQIDRDRAEIARQKKEITDAEEEKVREEEEKKRNDEAKLRAEADLKEKQERQEKERLEAEELERIRAVYEASLLPDKEKLRAFGVDIEMRTVPSLTTDAGLRAAGLVRKKIAVLVEFINDQANKLGGDEVPVEVPLKGGPLSKEAAGLCKNEDFQRFMGVPPMCDEACTGALRDALGIESRVEIDHNPRAAAANKWNRRAG